MRRDARKMRGAGPTVFAAVKHGDGLDAIIGEIFAAQRRALARRVGGTWYYMPERGECAGGRSPQCHWRVVRVARRVDRFQDHHREARSVNGLLHLGLRPFDVEEEHGDAR